MVKLWNMWTDTLHVRNQCSKASCYQTKTYYTCESHMCIKTEEPLCMGTNTNTRLSYCATPPKTGAIIMSHFAIISRKWLNVQLMNHSRKHSSLDNLWYILYQHHKIVFVHCHHINHYLFPKLYFKLLIFYPFDIYFTVFLPSHLSHIFLLYTFRLLYLAQTFSSNFCNWTDLFKSPMVNIYSVNSKFIRWFYRWKLDSHNMLSIV